MSKTVVEHKKFICVNFKDTNNNKYWQYTLYDDDTTFVEWGRVGGRGDSQYSTKAKTMAKLREKTNERLKIEHPDKYYTEVKAIDGVGSTETNPAVKVGTHDLKEIAKKQIKFNNPVVAKFVEFLTDVNAHQILKQTGGGIKYDATTAQFKTPMGIVIPEQVSNARNVLFELAKMVKADEIDTDEFSDQLQQYLRLIPHDVGMRKIDPHDILGDMNAVQKENDVLDSLEASFNDVINGKKNGDTDKKVAAKVDEPKLFDVELHTVDDSKIIDRIRKFYNATRKAMHASYGLDVHQVYRVIINHMDVAFQAKGKPIGNIMELWHGTKCSNLLSILKHGMIIPPSSASYCCGRMFGDGLYFSDQSTKSLNYATNYWGSGGRTDRTFMFLVDVAMGKFYTPKGSYESLPKAGYDSTFAKANASGVMNNEMIVYKTYQANVKYLVEFK